MTKCCNGLSHGLTLEDPQLERVIAHPSSATSHNKGVIEMAITHERVYEIFKGLENGEGSAFFHHVADNVDFVAQLFEKNPIA